MPHETGFRSERDRFCRAAALPPYGDMGALPKRHRHEEPQRSSLIKFFPPFFKDMTAFPPARDGEFLLKWT